MNKRIADLHNQTMYWVADNGGLRISDRIPTGYTEKFADLIVQECIEIIEPCKCGCRCEQEVIITDSIIADIKEHFGVDQ